MLQPFTMSSADCLDRPRDQGANAMIEAQKPVNGQRPIETPSLCLHIWIGYHLVAAVADLA